MVPLRYFIPLLALASCAAAPDLGPDATPDTDAAFIGLQPVAPLLARAEAIAISPEVTEAITARLSALQARAAQLRGPVVDPATRRRMRQAQR